MKTKHTPGPWFRCLDQAEGQTLCCIVREGEKLGQVEEVIGWINRYTGNSAEANARLISAAPELLEACKALQKAFQKATPFALDLAGYPGGEKALDMMDAAILKAEGREG